jgi:hypothetical protein
MPYSAEIFSSHWCTGRASLLSVDSKASGNSKFPEPMDPINIDQVINLYDFEKLPKRT